MKNVKDFNTVWMSLTYDCNNKCGWCYAASNFGTPNRREFPIEKETETLSEVIQKITTSK